LGGDRRGLDADRAFYTVHATGQFADQLLEFLQLVAVSIQWHPQADFYGIICETGLSFTLIPEGES